MSDLYKVDPATLSNIRIQTHAACQWATKAARANLAPAADDSHSNFGWDERLKALVSRTLNDEGHAMAFSFERGALLLLEKDNVKAELPMNGISDWQAGDWVDAQLKALDLHDSSHAEMPYDIESVNSYRFDQLEVTALGQWFQLGFDVLSRIAEDFGDIAVVEPTVRCWPHHYDVGTLLLLDDQDPETARSIGIGLSPGDGSYNEPYFYCSPWPVPELDELGSAPDGLHWHTDGFVSLISTADSLRSVNDPSAVVANGVKRIEEILS